MLLNINIFKKKKSHYYLIISYRITVPIMYKHRVLLIFLICVYVVQGCTNILVTPGASKDGNPMIAYNADDYSLFGSLYHYPPSQNNGQKMRKCYSWDSGVRNIYIYIQ